MGTFIALCLGAVFWLQHRHVKKLNKAREEQRRKDMLTALEQPKAGSSHVVTIASIEIKDERIW